jgi:hypothetical protein
MKPKELSNMRLKQVVILNGLVLAVMFLYFTIINTFAISLARFFLILGVLMLFQGVFGFIKGDSTKSIIPILEKVAIYEKRKMGSEWNKQRKVGYVWNVIFSCFLFLQSYSQWGYTENVFQIELKFIVIMTFFF